MSRQHAQIGDVQSSNDIGADSFGLVVFAPINVGTTSDPSRHEHVRRFDFIKFLGDIFAILYPNIGRISLHVGFDSKS
jgi:hypothetical protein